MALNYEKNVLDYIVNYSAYFLPISVIDVFGDAKGRLKLSKTQYRKADAAIIKVKQQIIDEHKKLFPKYWERCRTTGQDEEALRILKEEGKENWALFFKAIKNIQDNC